MQLSLKKLLPIPILLFILSLAVFAHNYYKTGELFLLDVDLKGGTLISIATDGAVDTAKLESELSKQFSPLRVSGLSSSSGYGIDIEVSSDTNVTAALKEVESRISVKSYSVETIGPELGKAFFKQVTELLIAAYVLMAIAIYLAYRNLASSFGIVFASLGNVLTTLALTSLLGIRISFAGFAALLMLIAYTVDTNIVLTSKVLKSRKEEFNAAYKKALITGVTLIATITATMVLTQFISTSRLLVNIAQILSVGFINDLAYTWILNAYLLERVKR